MSRGATLAEVVVALTCGLLVVQLSFAGLAKVRSVERGLIRRSETLAAWYSSRLAVSRYTVVTKCRAPGSRFAPGPVKR